ncbi:hypothetical protein [Moorena producens]|uniref:hypothetical protein n=1 Tax=Moorena producens TaxID=1155739 RepID=UPI003C78701B
MELASCQFQYIFVRAGCPLYSYSLKDRRNGLYIIIDNNLCRSSNNFSSLLPIPCSQIRCSLFPLLYKVP